MTELFNRLRELLSGKKTYLLAVAGILTALIAFANGDLDSQGLVMAVYNALAAVTIRAGVGKVQ